jgi:ribose transport system substrate-binding protein
LVLAATLLTGCGSSGSSQSGDGDAGSATATDTAGLCPTKPIRVAFAKGAGDTWTKISLATLKDEAAKCKNIKDVLFTDAGGDQTKGIADLNGLVAQGTDVLIVMPEFGPAELPAMRAAVRAGTTVVAQIDDVGGKIGTDVSASVLVDTTKVGQQWADWLNESIGSGKVVFLGGIPGAQSSKQLFDALQKGLRKYPKLQLVVDHVVDTDWNAGTRQRVMGGLLAKYGRIDAVVSDYGTIDYGTLNAYKQADLKLPALAAFASSNGTACYWKATPFDYMSVDGQTTLIRESLRAGLRAFGGQMPTKPTIVDLPVIVDTNADKKPKCDTGLPDDAAIGSDLSPEALHAIFK